MRKDTLVYISGPITPNHRFSIEDNVAEALRTFISLTNMGIPAFCPHLVALAPSCHLEVKYTVWLEYDLVVITRCTHMLMLPRWKESSGAMQEMEYAKSLKIPILFSLQELLEEFDA
jgi:Domain of unknown function (DUF4406)